MACAKCDFYTPKDSSRTQLPEARANLQRMLVAIPLTDDEIADWYEQQFLGGQGTGARTRDGNPLDLGRVLRDLLEEGSGSCLEIGCGTGVHAAQIRDDSLPAVIAMMVHTDMPAYPAVLREAARVRRPGAIFVHVGVHPCFCGGFADRSDLGAVVIRPGYLDGHWTKASWTDQGVRAKVGATHRPLPELMHSFLAAGLILERFSESGEPTPVVLAIRARKGLTGASAAGVGAGGRGGVAGYRRV